jgi:hypothetical protein
VATASVAIALVLETDELRTTVTVGRPAQAALKILGVLLEKRWERERTPIMQLPQVSRTWVVGGVVMDIFADVSVGTGPHVSPVRSRELRESEGRCLRKRTGKQVVRSHFPQRVNRKRSQVNGP